MDVPRGRVILFGRTGAGKSTVANALVSGGIEGDLCFKIGHGVRGCTSDMTTAEGRGWTVTDTVGLGEGQGGSVESEDAEQRILDFLKRVRGEYSHVIYVKSSTNRFDVLDESIWKTFLRIFDGAQNAFTILFTKGDDKWLNDNWKDLPRWVQELGRANVLITDIPPVAPKPKREERNQEIRRVSINKLDKDLWNLFRSRGGQYQRPKLNSMDDAALEAESRSILDFIKKLFTNTLSALATTAAAVTAINTILCFFADVM